MKACQTLEALKWIFLFALAKENTPTFVPMVEKQNGSLKDNRRDFVCNLMLNIYGSIAHVEYFCFLVYKRILIINRGLSNTIPLIGS